MKVETSADHSTARFSTCKAVTRDKICFLEKGFRRVGVGVVLGRRTPRSIDRFATENDDTDRIGDAAIILYLHA